ncbi:MAG: DedA family protein [Gammaproteobacteria bacterium]|nr:DedA family protein [Gammaproteobacteria bacterium]MCP5137073.1 DedA family protein [Gammaproteobacteria bacterium]
MSLETLVSTYGYAAVGIGAFVEGETIVMLGGFAAHRGYLELPWVILVAFLGSFIGDQFYFHLGRAKGEEWIRKLPHVGKKSDKVFALLNKHQTWLILGFRFLYGLRTVTPILVGAARISPARFFLLNFLGAMVWAIVIGAVGYVFGNIFKVLLGDLKRYEMLLFAAMASLGLVFWMRQLLAKKRTSG